MAVTEIGHVYQLHHRCRNSPNSFPFKMRHFGIGDVIVNLYYTITSPMPKCPILKGKNYLGYFGIGDVIDTRDLSLSQPFLAILATLAYTLYDMSQKYHYGP